jgi:PAS domain S-box-containing protein
MFDMKPSWQNQSREQLIAELSTHDESLRPLSPPQAEALLHDLHVQKVELEVRNYELRESRRMLEESRARYAELYDFAPIALCTLDPEGRIIEANLALAALIGGEHARLDRCAFSSVVVPEDRQAFRNHLRRCLAQRTRSTTEVRLKLKDLGIVHFQVASTPLLDDQAQAVGCKTVLTDVSSLKRSEERLSLVAAASASLASSFDVSHTLSLVVRSLVPAAADLCFIDLQDREEPRRVAVAATPTLPPALVEGLSRGPIPRSTVREAKLVSQGGGELVGALLADLPERAAIVDGLAVRSVVTAPLMVREQVLGTLALVGCGAGRAFTEADLAFAVEIASRAAMAIDNARLYHAAERAVQVRQEVLSIVSHDLKTPVTGILLSCDGLLEAAPQSERRRGRRAIDRIKRTARQMEHIVDDLLDMVGMDNGHLSLEPSAQCVRSLIDDAMEQLAPMAAEKKIAVAAEHTPQAQWVECDGRRVLQVLINLIGNAIKFAPDGGHVAVTAEPFEGKVRVSVRDDGPGIPSSVLRNLFQRYWQAKDTAKRGRGLGLFICKGIVEAHGGTIWVESKPAHGTTFHFTVPAAARAQPTFHPTGKTVMVVEDDHALREQLRGALTERGWGVALASDGREALQYLQSGGPRPAVMVVDLNTPPLNGKSLLGTLKAEQRYADIPVVVLASSSEPEFDGSALGAVAALKKPVDVSALVALIEQRTPAAPV